jgi:diadenosine tetraphosphate (Ap4A) HIT family hydrolase
MSCVFCSLPLERIVAKNDLAIVIRDAFPVSAGHTLVIPRRHVASYFETTAEERLAMFELLEGAKRDLDNEFAPAAFNIGINDGQAAGQTVMHLHMHLIPRYAGDLPDPRGGVRWIFPEKADYWSER